MGFSLGSDAERAIALGSPWTEGEVAVGWSGQRPVSVARDRRVEARKPHPDIPGVNKASKLPTLILFLFCLDAILVGVYVVDAQMGSPLSKHTNQQDLAAAGTFPAWLLGAKYLLSAGLVWFGVRGRVRGGEPRTWALMFIPALLMALSIDVVTHMHESMGIGLGSIVSRVVHAATHLHETGTWTLIVGVPALLASAGALFVMGRATFWKSAAMWRFVMGLVLPVVVALGLEAFLGTSQGRGALRIAFQAYFQMLGATLMLWAAREQALADLAEIVQLAKASAADPVAGKITIDPPKEEARVSA